MAGSNSNFFRDIGTAIFKPVGDLVGGAVTALQPGRVQQMRGQQQNIDINRHLQIMRGDFSPEIKEQSAQAIMQSMDPEIFEKMSEAGQSFHQRQQGVDELERAGKLGLAAQRLLDAGADEASEAVIKEANRLTGVGGQIEGQQKADANRKVLTEHFDAGIAQLRKEGGPGSLASEEQVGRLTSSFAEEAGKQGMDARNAELLFGELYDAEVGKRKGIFKGMFRDDVLPVREVIDNRGYFSPENFNEFTGLDTPDMSGLSQSATPDFPQDTTPKTLVQIGITETADQQTFQELEAELPNLDLRQAYTQSPADFQKIIKALRSGKAPNGKPFTIKDAISLIQGNM